MYWYMYRWNLMVLSSLSSRDCARKFRQVLPQWSNRPITIFHPRDGKSPLARLPLAPWLLARHLVRACHNNHLTGAVAKFTSSRMVTVQARTVGGANPETA